ncbi:MAG: DNA/RNA nuclease SfsA [Alphaproteobacteria bacterium]|nr:DNA/RNA nuclease SfsA [Alphaproteobacteria bacterium]
MQFQTPLIRATLIRRYKRFLADVILPDGREVTAHCGNPGAMTGLKDGGMRVWIERNDDPKRKLRYSWKLCELPNNHWACVDTNMPNALVAEALALGGIPELAVYANIRSEVKYGKNSRIDFLLTGDGLPNCYVEVKAVTLQRTRDLAEFPDSVTERGAKHLGELIEMVKQSHRAVMLYVVHRTDCIRFKIAADVDANYARLFDQARVAGVEMLAYTTEMNETGVTLTTRLPVDPEKQI